MRTGCHRRGHRRPHRCTSDPEVVNHGRVGRAGITVTARPTFCVLFSPPLSLFFAQGAGHQGTARRIVVGQYLGFAAILAVAVAGAFGVTFLPEAAIPYLGLLPLALGMKAAWRTGRHGDDGAWWRVVDLPAEAEQEGDAEQAGAVDGQVGFEGRERLIHRLFAVGAVPGRRAGSEARSRPREATNRAVPSASR
ncbi:cadmium resistance transporter [Streptomyces camelliae]|uniref:Cadmium resistance transporter n=1 Tax=Streptomyces camelliae TaxID=3004093 RepID=A0ABY7P0G1_9ACTN|nr:cadmium resistance transporter [Streptomyces sp. HUAS 2-6]WBO63252.1 cadmium resistance transporter [Streptomyces sp. HUAS 2-6]